MFGKKQRVICCCTHCSASVGSESNVSEAPQSPYLKHRQALRRIWWRTDVATVTRTLNGILCVRYVVGAADTVWLGVTIMLYCWSCHLLWPQVSLQLRSYQCCHVLNVCSCSGLAGTNLQHWLVKYHPYTLDDCIKRSRSGCLHHNHITVFHVSSQPAAWRPKLEALWRLESSAQGQPAVKHSPPPLFAYSLHHLVATS